MNDAVLQHFREIADEMAGPEPRTWQWIGRWESQRMFGITRERAKEYAAQYGGEAKEMDDRWISYITTMGDHAERKG